MRVQIVADAESPIAAAWCSAVVEAGLMYGGRAVCDGVEPGRYGEGARGGREVTRRSWLRRAMDGLPQGRVRSAAVRAWKIGAVPWHSVSLGRKIRREAPDLLHALRIPFEGVVSAFALSGKDMPFAVSVWGNDFTLHAASSWVVRSLTRKVLRQADGLHSDCERDQRLAKEYGWDSRRPSLVVPGSGGIDPCVFFGGPGDGRTPDLRGRLGDGPWILNPRGIRAYVETSAFMAALPVIRAKLPGAVFVMPGTEGHPEAERLRRKSPFPEAIHLLPSLRPMEMAGLFRSCEVFVSPSRHDGTPNTLLEGMACGCYPIVGDVESVREWIVDGANGCVLRDLCPETIGEAVLGALSRDDERRAAAARNAEIIAGRAERRTCMRRVKEFYEAVVEYGKARLRN